ncbi:NAD(P)-binding domain-containing protein, partial [Bordetella pertussis]
MTREITIIGLGATGSQAAHALLHAAPDVSLTLYDRQPLRCEPFRGQATLAASAAEALRESAVIVLALTDEREIDRTLERFSDGKVGVDLQGKRVLDLCPSPPDWVRALGAAVSEAGADYRHADPREVAGE